MRVDRRWLLVAGLVVLALVGAGAVVVGRALGGPSCGVEVSEPTGTSTELVPVAELAPSGSVGDERQPVLDAVDGLGLGTVVAGRFFDSGVPSLVPVGGDLALAASRSVRLVALPDGEVRWGRSFGGDAAGGGLVGDRFVTLVGGSSPTLVSFAPDSGEVSSCVELPVAGGEAATLLTDQAATDVVVAVAPPASPVRLARVDPAGSVEWERSLPEVTEAGSVDVFGSSVVVGRLGQDPVRRSEMAVAGGIAGPTVTTWSLADGERGWTFPEDPTSTAADVVGVVDDQLLVLASTGAGRASEDRLVALDADGEQRWSVGLGRGLWSASLSGSLVLVHGADPRGGPQLRAFDAATGDPAWTVRSSAAPTVGQQPRRSFGGAVVLGSSLALPSPNGVLLVDPVSGEVERRDSDVAVEQLLPVGDHLVVRTDEALLVLRGN
ncbi:PQQ-binding-like beta-propeller repeat protein [Nocardioides caldifontis]|uniref:PQQ-binding-like beta-propeller repeat protein n=1 Tax=Nocardioides caldifontis TaxID=2588938 RepID=UPI0011E055C0|nr:PQQ-binding-like beta-propeller repeat protein [Nocardioides caldifontis]